LIEKKLFFAIFCWSIIIIKIKISTEFTTKIENVLLNCKH
jgi:hypothetical protein